MKTKLYRAFISALLTAVMLFSAVACSTTSGSLDLMDGIEAEGERNEAPEGADEIMTDFAVRLFTSSLEEGKNTLISPLSVLSALAMTANGAKGETKSQMESVLGMETGKLNDFFYNYMKDLPQGEKYKLSLANSVWFTDDERFSVNGGFLQMNANFYGADIYRAPFDDSTLSDINGWVNEKTDCMIPTILDNIPETAVMYLINALAFEADWAEPYNTYQIHDGIFKNADGEESTVDFMHSTESSYIGDDTASGFIKYFRGGKYAFAVLLPNDDISIKDYMTSLTGEKLSDMIADPEVRTIYASMPSFEVEYGTEMSNVLNGMGMTRAFDDKLADFTGLGTSSAGNISISRVIHKTFITVGAQGAKAGAATVVEMTDGAAMLEDKPTTIELDRPFVYMLIDREMGYPFFIGALYDIDK